MKSHCMWKVIAAAAWSKDRFVMFLMESENNTISEESCFFICIDLTMLRKEGLEAGAELIRLESPCHFEW